MILQAIGTPGLSGLDRMLSHFIAVEMQKIIKFLDKGIKSKTWSGVLKEFETSLKNTDYLISKKI